MTTLALPNSFANFQNPIQPAPADHARHPDPWITERILPDWIAWQELIDNLLRVRTLQDDYDGQGSEAPDHDLVDSAIMLACSLRDRQAPPAQIAVAGVNGTIHFEWINAIYHVDIEIIAPGVAEVYLVNLPDHSVVSSDYRW